MFSENDLREISRVADSTGIELASLLAIAEVESVGTAYWMVKGKKLPAIRFEGHYFYRKLKGVVRDKAVSAGLASPKAGAISNPRSYEARYALLERASAIDWDAAHESTSWGVGQVMGDKWKLLGYKGIADFVKVATSGLEGQVEIMARFIKTNGLNKYLINKDWKAFARAYNGPGYAANRYDKKIASAYEHYAKIHADNSDTAGKVEPSNSYVMVAKQNLKWLGYFNGNVDEKINREFRESVTAFQKDRGLVPDGKFGKMTEEAVRKAIAERQANQGDSATGAAATSTATGAAVEIINQTVGSIKPVADSLGSHTLSYLAVFLIIFGAGIGLYAVIKKARSKV